jgi:5-methylcytosine-specific restriction endonuclease McrA
MTRSDLTGRPARRRKKRLLRDAPAVCVICGGPIDTTRSGNDPAGPTTEHLVAVSAGGSPTDPSNQALSHRRCNTRRGARTLAVARAELAPKPRLLHSRKWL